MSPQDSIQIKIAETDAEREAAYRLRYEVFGLEENDHRYSDHLRKLWIDEDDGPHSTVIIAIDRENRCVATSRLTTLRDREFIGIDNYQLPLLAPLVGLKLPKLREVLGRWDRGVVADCHRGQGLHQRMEEYLSAVAFQSGCHVMVGSVNPENRAGLHIVKKCGYKVYTTISIYRSFPAQAIYKDLQIGLSSG